MLWHTLLAERDGHVGADLQRALTRGVRVLEEFQRLEDEGRIDFRHTVTRAATEGWTRPAGTHRRRDAWMDLIEPGETLCFRLRTARAGW